MRKELTQIGCRLKGLHQWRGVKGGRGGKGRGGVKGRGGGKGVFWNQKTKGIRREDRNEMKLIEMK